MDYSKYKKRLWDYLKMKGVTPQRGLIKCINPQHCDHNPSCELFEDYFKCYSCGCSGDIYDAVELLEGITSKKDQYIFLENTFGGNYTPSQISYSCESSKSKKFEVNPESVKLLDNFIFNNKAIPEMTERFLAARIQKTTNGKIKQYPAEVVKNLSGIFGYWPGLDEALKYLTPKQLLGAGIPSKKNAQGIATWGHSGIVFKTGFGYKLHYYTNDKCEKRCSLSCQVFPTPHKTEINEPEIIVVEGEMDALVCQAAGIPNVYATGGVQGLTKPKIKEYLKNVKKLTILFDNDEAGKIAAGLVPSEHTTSLPQKLLQADFTGDIYVAELQNFKDPDEAICNNSIESIQNAIFNAKKYEKNTSDSPRKASTKPQTIKTGNLSIKDLKALIRTLRATNITEDEMDKALSAMQLAVKDYSQATPILQAEGVSLHRIQHRNEIKVEQKYLVLIANKYLSYYWQTKLKTILDFSNTDKSNNELLPIVRIDYESILKNPNLDNFLFLHGEMSAARIVAKILENRLIYIENDNKFYFFNGHVWGRCSDVPGTIYNLLSAIIKRYCYENEKFLNSPDGSSKMKSINSTKRTIEQRKWRAAVTKELSEIEGIFHESISFDGTQIQETLTLIDGVLDFSGKTIKIRESKPEEYRLRILPYKVDDVIDSGKPENFLKFMQGNFKSQETLDTLFYYLSLIPSRCAQYKVGGIFIGTGGTGKTTTMKIISDLYPQMTTAIPREVIMLNKDIRNFGGGANPAIAELKGMGAGISDETQRNDMLNSAVFKQLTGGGAMKARRLYSNPEEFKPTAQTIILTNYLPRFDNKDPATIDRMVVIPFSVEHKRGESGFKDENDIFELLRPEYPAVIKFFAEYYIELKTKYKGKIPLSKECQDYKGDYVEDQATDLDRFVKENIEFIKGEGIFVKVKDVYMRYCEVNNIELNDKGQPVDKDSWTQNKLTHFLKSDYTEIHIKQKRFDGGNPEQIIINMRLKENESLKKKSEQQELVKKEDVKMQPKKVISYPDPDDNPWDDVGGNDEPDIF